MSVKCNRPKGTCRWYLTGFCRCNCFFNGSVRVPRVF